MFDPLAFFQQFLPPPKEAFWTPEYEPTQYVTSADGQHVEIKQYYLATASTAEHLRAKYGAAAVIEQPFYGAGGPNTVTEGALHMRLLCWPDGTTIIAGLLAQLWTQNAAYPDTAHALCLQALRARGITI